jgi:hypothetical protein
LQCQLYRADKYIQYNNTKLKDGLIQMCEQKCGFDDGVISGNTLRMAQFTAMLNRGYALVTNWLLTLNKQWRFDDSNYTDFPISTTTLVDNQRDYTIPDKLLKLRQIEVLDLSGNYYPLNLLEEEDYRRKFENMQEEAGKPNSYYLLGNSVFLYPKPTSSYATLTAGLRFTYDRYADYFTVDDTTQQPGFAETMHQILPYLACIEYTEDKDMARYNVLKAKVYEPVIGLKSQLETLYLHKDANDKSKITRKRKSYK